MIRFLRTATSLEYLDIRECLKITNDTINAAVELIQNRKNNVILEVRMHRLNHDAIHLFDPDTKPNINEIAKDLPLLHLIY